MVGRGEQVPVDLLRNLQLAASSKGLPWRVVDDDALNGTDLCSLVRLHVAQMGPPWTDDDVVTSLCAIARTVPTSISSAFVVETRLFPEQQR